MASQLIGTTETGWFNPGANPPPFDMKLLLMVAGSRSEDCGRTFEPYTVVMTAYVQQQGPGDEYDDEPAFDEYMAGDQTDFLDFQFNLKDEDGEVLDWYSDSIVAWAYYPLGIAQTAVNVERELLAAQNQQKPEPFGYFKAEPFGWTDCAETDEGAIALYEAPQPLKDLALDTERLDWLIEQGCSHGVVYEFDKSFWMVWLDGHDALKDKHQISRYHTAREAIDAAKGFPAAKENK